MNNIWIFAIMALLIFAVFVFPLCSCSLKNSSNHIITTHELTEDFNKIQINTSVSNITFELSDNDSATVVCREKADRKHNVTVADGTLSIEKTDTKKWYHIFNFDFTVPSVTVYLPRAEYTSLQIKSSTGNITIPEGFNFTDGIGIKGSTGSISCSASANGTVKIDNSTGNVSIRNASASKYELDTSTGMTTLDNVTCESIVAVGTTGDFFLLDSEISESVKISRDTGDIEIRNVSARHCNLTLTTGTTDISNLKCESLSSVGDTGKIIVSDIETSGNISIARSTGNSTLNSIACNGNISMVSTTGKQELKNTTCANLNIVADTGKLVMNDVIANGSMTIERSTGDVDFTRCDAYEITIKTTTGDVKGTLLSDKIFTVKTSTGKTNIPESASGGACKITTSTGDIEITIG